MADEKLTPERAVQVLNDIADGLRLAGYERIGGHEVGKLPLIAGLLADLYQQVNPDYRPQFGEEDE